MHCSVAAGDGGAGVPSLFHTETEDLGTLGGIDASVTFTKGSLCSMKFFATKKHDMKKLEEIASILKKFHDCGMQLEKFEREQKERV